MGLLDQIGGMLGGSQQQGGTGDILAVAQHLLEQNGGVQGLVQKFQQGGLGDAVASWVGTGQNLPVSADQIKQVLGNGQLTEIAGKLGLDPSQLSTQLAQHLPGLVDKLTPNGQVPQGSGDLLAQGADLLKGFLKS
jgi:uncharacterized protein YidB (DUF937 family)